MSKFIIKYAQNTILATALILTAGCSGIVEDRPILMGNTMDQYNRIDYSAPIHSNVNISYEFSLIHENHESDVDDFWFFRGDLEDMQSRYVLVGFLTPVEGQEIIAGQVVTQGPLRMTSYESCFSPDKEMDEKAAKIFSEALQMFRMETGLETQQFYSRRFVANSVEEEGRRLEVTYFIDLDAIGKSCDDVPAKPDPDSDVKAVLDKWKAESLRSFEVIG